MAADVLEAFSKYLTSRHSIGGDLVGRLAVKDGRSGQHTLRDVWQLTELSAGDFADEVAHFYELARISFDDLFAAKPLIARFSRRFLHETALFPFEGADGRPRIALADPTDRAVVRAAEIVLNGPIEVVVASFDDIGIVLQQRLGDEAPAAVADEASLQPDEDVESLRDLASGAPVVRALNDLMEKAVALGASDIHIEPFRSGLVVRMRVDGLLRPVPTPAGALPQALLSRIKILAGLNIAERRLPQDGSARIRVARSEIDVRIATMPTLHGECAAIRLLPRDRGLLDIRKLGLTERNERTFNRLLDLPNGMIIVTGPTGSGKTTTLATILTILNQSTRKILTIEDPVEYEIPGVNQSQVKPEIGLTFSTALRAFVRHDPQVIMVGEIRDRETANIAIHAALTGHLVLTTLHTETAAGAVPRLLDLGVEGFLLKSTLRAVIAQRLVRILCDRCKAARQLSAADLDADPRYVAIGLGAGDTVYEPRGCDSCERAGYRGRTGAFEVIEMVEAVRRLIGAETDSFVIEQAAIDAGMVTMIGDAIAKCRAGVTSAAEVLRVTAVR